MSDAVSLVRNISLEGRVILHDRLIIRSVPAVGKIMLQCSNAVTDHEMEIFGKLFGKRFGLDLPMQVCRKSISNDGSITAMRLCPNSWIILCDEPDIGIITEWLEASCGDMTLVAAEVTDQYICLDIEGGHARTLLAKGCALDLTAQVFSDNHMARTLLAQANIILWRCGDGFRILIDVSLSDYLWQWLEEASGEFTMDAALSGNY